MQTDLWGNETKLRKRKTSETDLLLGAIVGVCWPNVQFSGLTQGQLGAARRVAADFKKVGISPDEVRTRAARYREMYSEYPLTPASLSRNWASLAPEETPDPKGTPWWL